MTAPERTPDLNPRDGWRLNGGDLSKFSGGHFDEVVVGKWLHVERMSAAWWFVRLGDRVADVHVDARGKVTRVTWREDE